MRPSQIIFPHEAHLKHACSEKGLPSDDLETMCKNKEVAKLVCAEVNDVGKKAGLKPLEVGLTILLSVTP